MHEEENEQLPSNILPALKRFKLHLSVAIPLLLVIAVIMVLLIPPVYRSAGRIIVETQQIPPSLVQSTITNVAAEQIEIITQRVMTREKLLNIIGAHSYFGYRDADPIEQNRILNEFRRNVGIEVTSAKSGREIVAIGFSVSFDSDSPAVARAVADKLVKLFLNENIKARTERASETTEFLKAEAEKIRVELDRTEAEVAEFKLKNKDSLPEHLDLYVEMREDARRTLSSINEATTVATEQIKLLENQLSLSKEQGSGWSGEKSDLASLRQEYNRKLLQYQPNHPDMVVLRDKIDQLEQGGSIEGLVAVETDTQRSISNQISSLKIKLKHLSEEKAAVIEKINDLESRIIKIPQVERGFTAINRNYQTILEQYQSIQSKAQSAAMAESLEQESKAERFILLEPPILPVRPAKPDRKKLMVLAIVVAIGMPIAFVMLIGFLDKSIRSPEALTNVVGVQPLVEIPYISTQSELHAAKRRLLYGGVGIVAALILGVLIMHTVVMPLDVFFTKVISRMGM